MELNRHVFTKDINDVEASQNDNGVSPHTSNSYQKDSSGPSLVVQWLRIHAFTARGMGSIPGQGNKTCAVR